MMAKLTLPALRSKRRHLRLLSFPLLKRRTMMFGYWAGIAESYPDEKLIMRITRLGEETGAFRAESIKRHSRRSGKRP
jgi:hypothetical protein